MKTEFSIKYDTRIKTIPLIKASLTCITNPDVHPHPPVKIQQNLPKNIPVWYPR